MYRIAIVGLAALSLAGCALNSSVLTSGFAGNPTSTASISPSSSDTGGVKLARLNDKAPTGTFEKAPSGSLTGRDYSKTRLNIEMARDIINQYRKDNGLKPLVISAELTAAAKSHSRDLAKWDRISHYGSDGSNPWDRVKRTGYKPRLAAENVGTGQATFEDVMKGWKKSPGHNKNLLLADARQMGLALVYDPKTEFKSFWTLVIGTAM
ncbi:MAG: CAP domain-containing protein [Hyphomicrobiaceae bacterium]|nr:CAP domain-containing protein [Hyphomicrobiaceae bacterium]MCC0010920.1 CAP domain-containing protein [Hyphomicrobiaceae bacterium]